MNLRGILPGTKTIYIEVRISVNPELLEGPKPPPASLTPSREIY